MADRLDKERRSWNMSRIRSKNTKPEMAVRRALHAAGFRFRLHVKDLPGKPDIVLPKWKTVVFVHGCFWHRHLSCRKWSVPASNKEYWEKKFAMNIERDQKAITELIELGWSPIVLWECEVKKASYDEIVKMVFVGKK